MPNYVLPPQFDFLNNPDVDPIVMYFFEFEYTLDRDDLSYIWQNLAPREYQKITKTSTSVAHKFGTNELMTVGQFRDPNTRFMLFKVKQRGQAVYENKIASQVGDGPSSTVVESGYPLEYNWPYDYVSFVKMIKLDGTTKMSTTLPDTTLTDPEIASLSKARS